MNTTVFICGEKKDHICDTNGDFVYFMLGGKITTDRREAEVNGNTGGSVTCSVCGTDSMTNSMWRDE